MEDSKPSGTEGDVWRNRSWSSDKVSVCVLWTKLSLLRQFDPDDEGRILRNVGSYPKLQQYVPEHLITSIESLWEPKSLTNTGTFSLFLWQMLAKKRWIFVTICVDILILETARHFPRYVPVVNTTDAKYYDTRNLWSRLCWTQQKHVNHRCT